MKPKLSGSKEWLFWYEAQERKYEKESERLQARNAELLAACRMARPYPAAITTELALDAAIARAKGRR